MEGTEIPFYGTSIECTKVPSIDPRRILSFFNQFVSQSVRLLNNFAVVCEAKLEDLDLQLQRSEATLLILEAKLASVPLEAAAIPVPSGSEPEPQPGATVPVPAVDATADHQVEEPVQNPLVDRFTKMLHVGVPLMAVEQKMRAEGLDPALLRQPPPAAASRASSDRSLSDTDDESNP